jgi:DNA-binding NtrC family response regulator
VAESADEDSWTSAVKSSREDRRLQSLRGSYRRRGDVLSFLRASAALANERFGRLQLESAARVAREALTWRRWWSGGAAADAMVLECAIALALVEQRARIERGRAKECLPLVHGLAWAATAAGGRDAAISANLCLTACWRLLGRADRARALLDDTWPAGAAFDVQLRWAREALWVSLLDGNWPQAVSIGRSLRIRAAGRDRPAQVLAARELATLYHCLGDDAARDIALRSCEPIPSSLSRLEQSRIHRLQAAVRTSGSRLERAVDANRKPRGCATPAMRVEIEHMSRWRRLHRRERDGCPMESWRSRRSDEQMMNDVLELLRVLTIVDDEGVAMRNLCGLLRERLAAVSIGIWTNGSADPLAGAGSNRAWPLQIAERARVTGLPHGPEKGSHAIEAAWPVKHANTSIAAIAAQWLPDSPVDDLRVKALLTAASAACGPLVRSWLDRASVPPNPDAFGLIGESRPMRELRSGIHRAALVPYHVLVEGESGSGKELVARAIHQASARRQKRFCAVNCAALTDDLLEAELFGHARGAFTGALAERAGLFEDASGGTLLLDEVADLSARGQAKVLRVIQDGDVRRLGENFSRHVDVRIVAATNKPLRQEAAQGRFREDLRYRLDVLRLVLPPLRDRREDVPLLAAHFWREASARVGSRAALDAAVIAALARYDWPGNVRELQNVIASLAVHAPVRGRVGPSALPEALAHERRETNAVSLDEARRRFEADYVRLALVRSGGRRADAAKSLGVTRQGLAKLMTRLGLDGG